MCVLAGVVELAAVGIAHRRAVLSAPAPTLLLLDKREVQLGEMGADDEPRTGFWVPNPLPARAARATMAIEDQRFFEHPGVDPRAVARALRDNQRAGRRVSGASTLAMQVARLQQPSPRTWPTKVVEALTALLLVDRYGHDRVLTHYLTLAPYGNNLHGIGYAARRYFDKPVGDLSWAETALLVALPQAPGTMNPYEHKGMLRAKKRAAQILDLLAESDDMDPVEAGAAHVALDRLTLPPKQIRPAATLHAVLELSRQLQSSDRTEPLVHTTIDLELNRFAEKTLREAVDHWSERGAGNAAALVVDRKTGAIRAWVGSTSWLDAEQKGAIDYVTEPRYPGSTLKPFLYTAALDAGVLHPTTVLDDLRIGRSGIRNSDGRFLGPLLPRRALANSRNIPAVHLARKLGLETLYGAFRDLELHDDTVGVDHYGAGVAIGGMPTSLLALVRAYDALASGGVLRSLRWTEEGQRDAGVRVFSEPNARRVGLWLSDPMARQPTFPRHGYTEYPYPVAVKTGTSPDYRDAFAVAWTEDTMVGVWVGHPDWRPMRKLGGYNAAAKLVQVLLHRVDGTAPRTGSLPRPRGEVEVAVCGLSGQRATQACDQVWLEPFAPSAAPVEDCGVHTRVAVDRRTGEISGPDVAPEHVGWRTFVQLRDERASWAASVGLPLLAPADDGPAQLSVVSPPAGGVLVRDPEAPAGAGTVELRVTARGDVEQVLWRVDGEELALVDAPWVVHWELTPGEHTFEAEAVMRDVRSRPVRVRVY
jgi:penicillin-binding protein 1C